MPQCRFLTAGVPKSCKPLISGTKDEMLVIDFADIKAVVPHATVKKAITLSLRTGKKAFAFEGANNSNVLRSDVTRGKYGVQYKQEVDLLAFGVDAATISTVEDLHEGRFITITENNNGFFEVAGLNAGLQTTKGSRDTANKDTGGAAELTLASEEEAGYPEFFMIMSGTTPVYDYGATKLAVQALKVAAV